MDDDDRDMRFEWHGDEYAFDDFAVGEQVQYLNEDAEDEPCWREGTVCRIDYDDPSLPWGVTANVEVVDQNGEIAASYDDVAWNWMSPNKIRKSEYVIDEEEEEPKIPTLSNS